MSANRDGYQGNQRDAGWLDKYERVDERIAKFREVYPGSSGRIETIPILNTDGILFEARISVRADTGEWHQIANAHAFDRWGQASQLEKTEKAAIGRALVCAGFSARAEASADEMERHAAQEDHGAARPPVGKVTTIRPVPEPAPAEEPSSAAASYLARAVVGRNSYRVIVRKGYELLDAGEPFEAIKAHFAKSKRAMNDEERADGAKELGRIKKLCEDRDLQAAALAEADEEIAQGEIIERGKPARSNDDQTAEY